MYRHLLLIPLLVLLVACQSAPLQRDFDPDRDFSRYRNWGWKEPALQYRPDDPRIRSDLTEQRVRNALAEQLEQRGLRPATASAPAQVLVQAWLIVEQRTQTYTSMSGGAWGGAWPGFWGAPIYADTRTVDYQVGTLQIDFYDAADGKLVWRGSTERILPRSAGAPAERERMLRETVAQLLAHYPPR